METKNSNILKVVCNSSPIINLCKLRRLDLLQKLYTQVIIPSAVHKELIIDGCSKPGVNKIQELLNKEVLIVQKPRNTSLVQVLKKDIDSGEAEVICLAQEIVADLVIMLQDGFFETCQALNI